MGLYESGEMYLETILLLKQKINRVRAIDVCEEMEFSKPSVSRALGLLKNSGMITVDENGSINLTEDGKKKADSIYDRHQVLTKLFIGFGVSEETAAADACKMEHYISDETFDKICEFVDKHP